MTIHFQIDRTSDHPIYRQIADQVRHQIRRGTLPVGTRLPSIRQLAEQVGVARLTVETAYDDLRSEGWIETFVGHGTFVAKTASPQEQLALLSNDISARTMLEALPTLESIKVLRSFAYAEPDEAFYPTESFWNIMNNLQHFSRELMGYTVSQGEPKLRVEIAKLVRGRGMEISPDEILITNGVTQGISLVVQALTQLGDCIIVEQPTHMTLLNLLETYGVRPVGIPMEADGMNLDLLEKAIIQYRPRFIYTIPNYHNPTGITLSPAKRQRLLQIAQRHGLLVVEDDIYGLISYENSPPPALKAQDEKDIVIYVNGFSKVLMPGLRLGYVIAPQPLYNRLVALKRSGDLFTPALFQHALATFIHSGQFKAHMKRVLPIYAARRDQLLKSLKRHMPPQTTWSCPAGGYCAWLTLPPGVDATLIQRRALQAGFAFTPGEAFFDDRQDKSHLRVCFGKYDLAEIDTAMVLLGELIREEMKG
jgi:GntR family transcriptional regulator/MocR family aminotransferase